MTSTMNPPSDTGGKPAPSNRVPGSSDGLLGSELIARLVQQVHTVEPREMRTSLAPYSGEPVATPSPLRCPTVKLWTPACSPITLPSVVTISPLISAC